jgi:hypothetical protein
MKTLTTSLFLLLAATLPAQRQVIYNDGSTAASGSGNAFPWGSEGIRYQQIFTSTQLGTKPLHINDILVAGRTSDGHIEYGDIEIRMGLTSLTTVTTDWAKNSPKPTTVYRGPLRVLYKTDKWNGIGLPKSYLYLPITATPNLCIEVIVWKVKDKGGSTGNNFYYPYSGASVQRAYLYQWTSKQTTAPSTGSGGSRIGLVVNGGNLATAGLGCAGSNAKVPALEGPAALFPTAGTPYTVSLKDGPATSAAILFVGTSFTNYGAIPLPFDLNPLGAKGCMVWHDHLFSLSTGTSAAGAGSVKLFVPAGFPRVRIYASWWCVDKKANTLGLTVSDFGKMVF